MRTRNENNIYELSFLFSLGGLLRWVGVCLRPFFTWIRCTHRRWLQTCEFSSQFTDITFCRTDELDNHTARKMASSFNPFQWKAIGSRYLIMRLSSKYTITVVRGQVRGGSREGGGLKSPSPLVISIFLECYPPFWKSKHSESSVLLTNIIPSPLPRAVITGTVNYLGISADVILAVINSSSRGNELSNGIYLH